jgi:hypothetical protein
MNVPFPRLQHSPGINGETRSRQFWQGIRFTESISTKSRWVGDRSGIASIQVEILLYVQHHGKYILRSPNFSADGSNRPTRSRPSVVDQFPVTLIRSCPA